MIKISKIFKIFLMASEKSFHFFLLSSLACSLEVWFLKLCNKMTDTFLWKITQIKCNLTLLWLVLQRLSFSHYFGLFIKFMLQQKLISRRRHWTIKAICDSWEEKLSVSVTVHCFYALWSRGLVTMTHFTLLAKENECIRSIVSDERVKQKQLESPPVARLVSHS